MGSQKIEVTYSKPGTQPPMYLAGSFSGWQPQEMEHVTEHGEYVFKKEVEVEEGKEYQYKFRVGEGDWWLLNEDAPTVTDDVGNRNNLLAVSTQQKDKAEEKAITEDTHKSEPTLVTPTALAAPIHEPDKTEETSESGDTQTQTHKAEETTKTKDISQTQTSDIMPPRPILPTLAVEKTDSEARYGDKTGGDATYGQNEPHKLGAKDSEPDYDIRSNTRTPDIARSAAEVADSAMILDRDTPTPPMSDEEAGRTGYRRMSQTPIPQVADTAAEVADSAAVLDHDIMPNIDFSSSQTTFAFDLPDTPDSGASTPPEDKVPLFAHECIKPPPGGFEPPTEASRDPIKSKLSITETAIVENEIDLNDPTLEEFPSERRLILERVRTSQTRLAEDETHVDGIPPSPVVRANYHPERMDLPAPSPSLVAQGPRSPRIFDHDRSPSLRSIAEDGEESYREEHLSLPEGTTTDISAGESRLSQNHSEDQAAHVTAGDPSVDVQEVPESPPLLQPEDGYNQTMDGAYMEPEPTHLPPIPSSLDGNSGQIGQQQEEPGAKELVKPEEGPEITVSPATPSSSLKTTLTDPFNKAIDTAKATAIEEEDSSSQLTSRKPTAPVPERPITPASMRSSGKDARSKNFLRAFWRVVFVEWIGGFIMRLCGGNRRKAFLGATALLFITLAPAVYFSV